MKKKIIHSALLFTLKKIEQLKPEKTPDTTVNSDHNF